MNKYRKAGQGLSHVSFIAMLAYYYFFVGVLCWSIIVPDQASFTNALKEGGVFVISLYWGGIFGCFLGFTGLLSAIYNAGDGVKKPLLPITTREMIDYCICSSFILVPLFVLKNNLIIRASVHPFLLMVLTIFFLITVTSGYLQIQRTYRSKRVLRREGCV